MGPYPDSQGEYDIYKKYQHYWGATAFLNPPPHPNDVLVKESKFQQRVENENV